MKDWMGNLIVLGAVAVGGYFLYKKLFPDAQAAAFDAGQAAGQATADLIGGIEQALFGDVVLPTHYGSYEINPDGTRGNRIFAPSIGPVAYPDIAGSILKVGNVFNPTYQAGITLVPKGSAPVPASSGPRVQNTQAIKNFISSSFGTPAPKKVVVGNVFNPTFSAGIKLI